MPVVTNIEDLRRLARRKVPKALFDYVDTGSYDEISYRANSAELKAVRFRQRVLIDTSEHKLSTTMLGEPVAMPVAIAPTGLAGLLCGDGEMVAIGGNVREIDVVRSRDQRRPPVRARRIGLGEAEIDVLVIGQNPQLPVR